MSTIETHDHEIPHPRVVHFKLDGEEFRTDQHDQTPNSILTTFGKKDPNGYYLIHLEGHRKISYQGQGEHRLHLEQGDRFLSVRLGPTPVSDVERHGVASFVQGLEALGIKAQIHPSAEQHVYFAYTIEEGSHAGKSLQIGIIVPPDFPVTPPGGLHVSPQVHGGVTVGNEHPKGGIHGSPFGAGWEYWSRPHPTWQTEVIKSVGTYMAHVRRLWATQ